MPGAASEAIKKERIFEEDAAVTGAKGVGRQWRLIQGFGSALQCLWPGEAVDPEVGVFLFITESLN